MLEGFIRRLGSLRTTAWILAGLVIVFLAGLIVPQKDLIGEEQYTIWKVEHPDLVGALEIFNLTDIYASPLIMVLWSLFFLNLLLVMARRLPLIVQSCFIKSGEQTSVKPFKGGVQEVVKGAAIDDVERVLRKRRYFVIRSPLSLQAVKNRFTPLATLFFHLSFLLLLAGGLLSFYSKFSNLVHIAEGEEFSYSFSTRRLPEFWGKTPVNITVEDIHVTYFKGSLPIDVRIRMKVKGEEAVIGINRPYRKGALSFVIKDIDVAPLFVIRDKSGREIDGAYAKLKVINGEQDSFRMQGYELRVEFSPDFINSPFGAAKQDKSDMDSRFVDNNTVRREITNPAVNIKVFKGESKWTKLLKLGEAFDTDEHSISFEEVRLWVSFVVVQDYGTYVVFAGIILMCFALVVRFLFVRKEIRAHITEEGTLITGKGEFFPELFKEEFDVLLSKISDNPSSTNEKA